jgi:hypothetical protein
MLKISGGTRRIRLAASTTGLAVVAATAPTGLEFYKIVGDDQAHLAPEGHGLAQVGPNAVGVFVMLAHSYHYGTYYGTGGPTVVT